MYHQNIYDGQLFMKLTIDVRSSLMFDGNFYFLNNFYFFLKFSPLPSLVLKLCLQVSTVNLIVRSLVVAEQVHV